MIKQPNYVQLIIVLDNGLSLLGWDRMMNPIDVERAAPIVLILNSDCKSLRIYDKQSL